MIRSLEQMEKIVSNNKNLSWYGWNVVELKQSNTAMFKKDGAFIDGKWYIKKVYECNENGWRIPSRYVA
jgi:hypothetical protein